MKYLAFSLFLMFSPLFSYENEIAGEVAPSQQMPKPPASMDSDEDVIIMEEDSDYQENEEEDTDTDSAEEEYVGPDKN